MEAVVRKLLQEHGGASLRIQKGAIEMMHHAGEDFVLELFKNAEAVRMTCKRVGLNEEHFKCAYQLHLDKDEGAR